MKFIESLYSLIDTDEKYKKLVNKKIKLNLYVDFLFPLAEEATLEKFCEENTEGEIFTIIRIFNANGQAVRGMNLEELLTGLYILQGVTKDGNLVSKKVIVNKFHVNS